MKKEQLLRTKPVESILKDLHQHPELMEGEIHADLHGQLSRKLKVLDLVGFGIAAIVGAGIFSTIGKAAFNGGPGISLLFIFTAVACAFSALCYAEFASRIPVSGSAYTYAYASFGELAAWIIGWDLLMEYAIGNIAVAISWSDYFTSFLRGFNIHLPLWTTMDFLTAYRGFNAGDATSEAYQAWANAPQIGGLHLVLDLPALMIVFFITYLVYRGINESRTASNMMVLLKLAVIFMVIIIGLFYINPDNWHPFLPNGMSGVMKGVSAVFFAYIGFDAISTTAEECENPQRDLPLGMMYSLIICTFLYVALSLVLTGLVSYTELNVGDPLAFVFERLGMPWISGIVAFSAIIAMASVLLVFQMGQPRIWMSMSRDGLLPRKFAQIHPKFHTPSFATIVTGCLVAIPALFMNLTEVTDLTSIGTLFAFVLVNAGILILDERNNIPRGKFSVPYLNGKYIVPVLVVGIFVGWYALSPDGFTDFFTKGNNWDELKHKLPFWLFMFLAIYIAIRSFVKSYSLIPVLGLLSCFYLMTELGWTNWLRFLIWLIIGLVIYIFYGYNHSKLRHLNTN